MKSEIIQTLTATFEACAQQKHFPAVGKMVDLQSITSRSFNAAEQGEKASKISIQVADMIAYIIYLFSVRKYNGISWRRRVLNVLSYGDERELLRRIEGNFNLEASPGEEFGIVHYPK